MKHRSGAIVLRANEMSTSEEFELLLDKEIIEELDPDDPWTEVKHRLGLDIFTVGRCPHINADGVQCSEICDRKGKHLFKC